MNLRIYLTVFCACAALTGAAAEELTQRDAAMRIHTACEELRSSDPEIKNEAVRQLFDMGGLTAYRILHLEWIADPNPEIKKQILIGFHIIGDHRHITTLGYPAAVIKDAVNGCIEAAAVGSGLAA